MVEKRGALWPLRRVQGGVLPHDGQKGSKMGQFTPKGTTVASKKRVKKDPPLWGSSPTMEKKRVKLDNSHLSHDRLLLPLRKAKKAIFLGWEKM